MPTAAQIGAPLRRVDGELKVTGRARYAGEHSVEGLLYGYVLSSAIAKGRIVSIDASRALAVPGVVEVLTHDNRPHIAWFDRSYEDDATSPGSPFRPLYDDRIHYDAQPIALVVADSFEIARYAVTLVDVEYERAAHNTNFDTALSEKFMPWNKRSVFTPPKSRGDAPAAYQAAAVRIGGNYRIAPEHHNPMEMHASTVIWEGDGKITVYDKTQGPQNVQSYLKNVFGLPAKDVRVRNPFVGGAFGSGLRPEYQVFLAVMAAKKLERSVRVTLTRQQMFTHVYRPECLESVSLASDKGGKLTAIIADATTSTSRNENYMETTVNWGGTAYACENAKLDYNIAPLDTHTPGDMRAPGAATGMTLFEIAMDELAYAADVDPLELRIRNYAEQDAMNQAPYTSKALMAAYREGAERFGWHKRTHEPRSMKEGKELVGWGVATGIWEALMVPASAKAKLGANGALEVSSAASDIGTGTYTIMAQIAADTLGLPIERITARLGDLDLPSAPLEGGSWTAASVGAAVQLACRSVAETLFKQAAEMKDRPLGDATLDQVEFSNGFVRVRREPSRAVSYEEIIRASGMQAIEAEETARPATLSKVTKSRNTHSAVFAEVKVDSELGVVRVTRVVSAVAAGRIRTP